MKYCWTPDFVFLPFCIWEDRLGGDGELSNFLAPETFIAKHIC